MASADAIARLEAVTSRLEALEGRLSGAGGAAAASGAAPAPAPAASDEAEPVFVKAYDDLLADSYGPVESGAKACGDDVVKVVASFKQALMLVRAILKVAGKSKKPDANTLQKVLTPLSEAIGGADSLKDRRSKAFNHLAMIVEGFAVLQWVAIEPAPSPFMSDVIPASEMYGNKVMMEFKGKDDAQVQFAKDFKAFLLDLQKYVKSHHTTGLAWNPRGGTDYTVSPSAPAAPAAAPAPPSGGLPPPPGPPPPPPPGFIDDALKAASGKPAQSGGGAAALFAELNAKADKVTAGLKRVTDDQKTHKNPALRGSSAVPAKSSSGPSAPKPAAVAKKPPKFEKNGNKYFIENYEENRELKVEDGNVKTAICMAKCNKSLLQIPSKINTLQVDGCVKSSVLVEGCVASVDIINCKSCEVQIVDWTPMITIDGCAGVIVYLSQRCVDDDISIVTSKCSELNIVIPPKNEEDDPIELPVHEQYETKIRNGQLVTTPISHVGA